MNTEDALMGALCSTPDYVMDITQVVSRLGGVSIIFYRVTSIRLLHKSQERTPVSSRSSTIRLTSGMPVGRLPMSWK